MCLAASTLYLLAALTLTGQGLAFAQEASPDKVAPSETDPIRRLAEEVAPVIVSLDATGSRSSEAIANSSVTLVLGGLKSASDLYALCQSAGDGLRTFVQNVAELRKLDGTVSKPACSGSGRPADPFQLTFQLHYEGGQNGLFNESPLLLDVSFPGAAGPDLEEVLGQFARQRGDRVPETSPRPVLLGTPHTETSHASIALPKNWSPDKLPDPIHADSPFASFDLTTTFADGKLVTDQKFVIKAEKVEAADRAAFEKWSEAANINNSVSVHLASSLLYPWSAFTGTTPEGKEAAALISSAAMNTASKHFTQAEADLNKAESLDPGHELLHRNRGELEEARGNYQAALAEYKEELKDFPQQTLIMENIAALQKRMGRTDDAAVTLEKWMSDQPDDIYPPYHLMILYHDMGRDDLAVSVGDRAMISLSEDGRRSSLFLSTYGHEQMLTSHVEGAQATLLELLDHTTDIEVVNDAAYFLSEHAVSLDRAEEALRASLKQVETEDNSPQPQHLYNMSEKQRRSLLFASWDTLGWILFQEHRAEEAESYIRAAWRNHADPAIGRHLGELLLSEDKPAEALDAFHLAVATIPAGGEKKASTDPDVIAILEAIEKLEKQGHVSSIKDPVAELARLRVLDAGAAGKRSGKEEFQLTLSASAVNLVQDYGDQKREATVNLVHAIKLPADFFPKGSEAQFSSDARLDCNGECTLTLLP